MSAEIGLGTAALGRPEYLNLGHGEDLDSHAGPERYDVPRLRSHALAVLDAAWDAGVRHYDAARSYGAAEEFLGDWLAAAPGRRREVRLGSKWGYTYVAGFAPGAAEHETKDHTATTLDRQWPETLAALGGPPDLYLVHSLTSDSPALGDDAVLGRLRDLAADGVRVGLSTSGADQADVLLRALALPGSPFSTVQSTWNPLEPSAGAALARAHDAGWLVVVKEAMANGRLAGPRSVLAPAAAELSSTPDAVALAVAAAQPWADVVLAGASTTTQLRANLAARDLAVPADGWEGVAEPAAAYWEHRRSLPWT
ncbi:aldo/keto reductase [Marmoricola sp. Leaf446]|uniref:aldo/keto reductase n=1 Tax=Marmoricola sp. Leaf446 TaxID=1736379 RepID=UPI0006FCA5B3|nr:aldo/keto reductase [Marmoricola sp. Leaf446]KQT93624.1 aldo/keto reductase [Marmoricola sp. Leaf446]